MGNDMEYIKRSKFIFLEINMNFPSRDKILSIMVALHANGDSSYRDAKNLQVFSQKKWGKNGPADPLQPQIQLFSQ